MPNAAVDRAQVRGALASGHVIDVQASTEVDVAQTHAAALPTCRSSAAHVPGPRKLTSIAARGLGSCRLNVIGNTVDEAISRLEKFLDESTVADLRELRIVHGHGTGQLRRAIADFLKSHPLVARFALAPQDQGGGGATIVELKD